jgi:molybdenum cofactor cytidylyltransferase
MEKISGLLTAAGKSTRMGTPKALLMWNGKKLINHQIDTMQNAGISTIVVVLGYKHDELQKHIQNKSVKICINDNYEKGRTSSILSGISKAFCGNSSVLLLSVDQPRPTKILKSLLKSHRLKNTLISYPIYNGKRGHPLIISNKLKSEFNNLSESKFGLRDILNKYRELANEIPMNDSSVLLDLNYYSEYIKAKREFD